MSWTRLLGSALAVLLVLSAGSAKPSAVATVSIGDDRLAYVETGAGETLILVHGGLQDYRVWAPVMEQLGRGYRVIAYSRRNHYPNRQGAGAAGTAAANVDARDLERLMDALGIARAHIVGHSAGAVAALTFAARSPERLLTLVVNEPPVSSLLAGDAEAAAVASAFSASFEPVRAAFREGRVEQAVALFADAVGGPGSWARRTPEQRRMMAENAAAMLGGSRAAPSGPAFDCAAARRISAPTLVTIGERSPPFFHHIAAALTDCLPRRETQTIIGSSHSVPVENPVAFADAVLGFLERH
jgi:non-heme chloroperoxidase